MTDPIIAGTDLSHHSDLAVVEAARRAERDNAPLLVGHVASEQTFALIEAEKVAQALNERVQSLTNNSAQCTLLVGSPHAELIRLSDQRGARLIVIGASGEGGIGNALFGTTAENVVRYAHGPVLVVRGSPERSCIVVGTDFSEASAPALRVGIDEAKKASAELVVLYSTHQPRSRLDLLAQLTYHPAEPSEADAKRLHDSALEKIRAMLAAEGAKGRAVVVDGRPGEALASYAARENASLVVVGTHGRTGLKRMALGSVAAGVVRNAKCSVLVVR